MRSFSIHLAISAPHAIEGDEQSDKRPREDARADEAGEQQQHEEDADAAEDIEKRELYNVDEPQSRRSIGLAEPEYVLTILQMEVKALRHTHGIRSRRRVERRRGVGWLGCGIGLPARRYVSHGTPA